MPKIIGKIKKAASLIISCGLEQRVKNFDYKVLLLKRSSKMRTWPNFHVFPGGGYDHADHSIKWLSVLLNEPIETKSVESEINLAKKQYHKIINQNSLGNLIGNELGKEPRLPYELSYRICAIRETFEETGILLARDRSSKLAASTDPKPLSTYYKKENLKEWHNRVQKDSSQFVIMCQELDIVPDILGLHEWANWITPVVEKYRFNTFFFTCFLENIPPSNVLTIHRDEIEALDVYYFLFYSTNLYINCHFHLALYARANA